MILIKKLLRKNFLQLKNDVNISKKQEIIKNIIFFIKSLKNFPLLIGIYYPIKYEPNILELMEYFKNIKFALPRINDKNLLEFVMFNNNSLLTMNKFNIPEPNCQLLSEIFPDIFFIPGIAFSKNGYRLGHGNGYYDKYFSNKNKHIIGVCWDEYLVEKLPYEPHDLIANHVITNKDIYLCCHYSI